MKYQILFEQWLEIRKQVMEQEAKASDKLREWDSYRTESGLVPDHIRKTTEYQEAKTAYDIAFTRLRNFNGKSPAEYKRKAAKLRRENNC